MVALSAGGPWWFRKRSRMSAVEGNATGRRRWPYEPDRSRSGRHTQAGGAARNSRSRSDVGPLLPGLLGVVDGLAASLLACSSNMAHRFLLWVLASDFVPGFFFSGGRVIVAFLFSLSHPPIATARAAHAPFRRLIPMQCRPFPAQACVAFSNVWSHPPGSLFVDRPQLMLLAPSGILHSPSACLSQA